MKMIRIKHNVAVIGVLAGLVWQVMSLSCLAQTAPSLPPGVQEVVKLAKAGLDEEVVLAHIRNAAAYYNLSVDQLIYLHDQGVSANEIKALMGSGGTAPPVNPGFTPAPAAVVPVPVPAAVPSAPVAVASPAPGPIVATTQLPKLSVFQVQLAPYGSWIDVVGYGLCWRPTVAATDPYWRPYCDQGYWAYTADGWFWQSDYPWGDIVFHYGRWFRSSLGWTWAPGYDWAPAWVCWRHAEGFCGWAPLPPGAVFKAGVGLWFGGRLAVDVDFGLSADRFTFVPYNRFWEHDLRGYLVPRDRTALIFGRSVVLNGYRLDHGHFIVEGLGRDRVAGLTHHEVRLEEPQIRYGFRPHEEMDRRNLHDDRKDRHDR